jgi:methylthioribose-1-phosphate isomerase
MKVGEKHYRSIWREAGEPAVHVIDQSRLPFAFETVKLDSPEAVAEAIQSMRVRGAPLIGVAGAFGVAIAMTRDPSDASLSESSRKLFATRPTAVNLSWALTRMREKLKDTPRADRADLAWREAQAIADEDVALNEAIGKHGLSLIAREWAANERPINILTHCNAGWIATVDWGTVTAPIYMAHDAGIPVHVWVDETRPRNQGLLTAWELAGHGVPFTLIADNAGGHLMQHKQVDLVMVGADRVTRRGDVCNKVGTYLKALAARDNAVPFYACVPSPTIVGDRGRHRGDPHRGTQRGRSPHRPWSRRAGPLRRSAHRRGRYGRGEPGLRRDAPRSRDRDHHGKGHRARFRTGPARVLAEKLAGQGLPHVRIAFPMRT